MRDTYLWRNDSSRERLGALAARLTAADLSRPVEDGWTVKALLAHLAFWDRYARTVLMMWQAAGFKPIPSVADIINTAAIAGWRQLPDAFVTTDVVTAAEAMDAAIASLPAALIQAITDANVSRFIDRSIHRIEHVEQIERVLGGEPPAHMQ